MDEDVVPPGGAVSLVVMKLTFGSLRTRFPFGGGSCSYFFRLVKSF